MKSNKKYSMQNFSSFNFCTWHFHYMSCVMRKLDFCLCENKGADQLCSICFRYTDSTIPLLLKSNVELLAIFCGCTDEFVSDLVENPKDQFSRVTAHMHIKRERHAFCICNSFQVGITLKFLDSVFPQRDYGHPF